MSPEQVCGAWVHVHEEDAEGERVFRPVGADLPPSRGRSTLELSPDGTYTGTVPGATDVPAAADGTWSIDGDLLSLADEGGSVRRLQVLAADAGRLVLRSAAGADG